MSDMKPAAVLGSRSSTQLLRQVMLLLRTAPTGATLPMAWPGSSASAKLAYPSCSRTSRMRSLAAGSMRRPQRQSRGRRFLCTRMALAGTWIWLRTCSVLLRRAAVEHTDGTASFTKLVDEAPRPFAPRMLSRKEQLSKRAAELIAAAQPGALGSPDSLDGGDLFFGGHSYGGPAALLAASSASAASPSLPLRGVLLHDPALGMGEDVWAIRRAASRPDVPTLSFVSDEYDKYGVRCGEATLHTIGGFHGNFVDAYAPWEDTDAGCHAAQSDAVALTLAALQCLCASRVLTGRYGHPSGSWPRFPCCYRRRARAIRS